jgi:hypothetical protein
MGSRKDSFLNDPSMRKIYHALTLTLHQPPGNLQWLLPLRSAGLQPA